MFQNLQQIVTDFAQRGTQVAAFVRRTPNDGWSFVMHADDDVLLFAGGDDFASMMASAERTAADFIAECAQ